MNQDNGNFNQFALGFVIGGIMGMLYAPKSGKENRLTLQELIKIWSEKAQDLQGGIEHKAAEVKEAAGPFIAETRERMEPIVNELKPIVAEKIEQVANLIEPIAQNAAEEAEEKIAEAVNPVIEKAQAELDETIEQARQEIRENIRKPRPRFFKGV